MNTLEKEWALFISIAAKRGATKEELAILIEASHLLQKYSPTNKD